MRTSSPPTPAYPSASRRVSPLPAAPLATSVIQSQGVSACSRAHQHMESRSLLKVIMRRLCSLLAGLCALSSRSNGCWMFRLVVTASPWDQGDLWPLRNGQTWKQKQRPFVQVKGKTSARLKMKKRRWGVGGALTLGELSFGLFRRLWWEVADGNVQRATVRFIIMTLIPFISLIDSSAASWLSRKKKTRKDRRISLRWTLQLSLSHHHRGWWSQLLFHFQIKLKP